MSVTRPFDFAAGHSSSSLGRRRPAWVTPFGHPSRSIVQRWTARVSVWKRLLVVVRTETNGTETVSVRFGRDDAPTPT